MRGISAAYDNVVTAQSEIPDISTQSNTACNNGFTPTVFKVLNDRLVPIRNKVTVSPVLASVVMYGTTGLIKGT
jgi:hypothetical protein